MHEIFTAFLGQRHLVSGPITEVALAVKRVEPQTSEPIAIFSDETGRAVDFDLRGDESDVLARLAKSVPLDTRSSSEPLNEPSSHGLPGGRPRGRPRLGVVAREVTLLPRHWEWLNAQPSGASVALRKLVEEARRTGGDRDRKRMAREAAYHFMSAMAGNLVKFEEAARALFADDRPHLKALIADWPADIRDHIIKLADS